MKKVFLIVLVLISFVLIGLGIYGSLNVVDVPENNDDKPNDTTVVTNKKISCSYSEFQDVYNANIETIIDVEFDSNEVGDLYTTTMKYVFVDQATYDSWKQIYSSNNMNVEIPGTTTTTEFDDANITLITTIKQKYSETPAENINQEWPNNYQDLKNYLINDGFSCVER